MNFEKEITSIVNKILSLAKTEQKYSGFFIGNTAKYTDSEFYFTPVRNSSSMVFGGIIVFNFSKISKLLDIIDGQIDYVFVDSERKNFIEENNLVLEDAVREKLSTSKLFLYKGNDLTVSAVDDFLSYLHKNENLGLRHKKITILGAGNIGSKLGLRLIERGASVVLTRKDKKKLTIISEALNLIKSEGVDKNISYEIDNLHASKGAEILIGTTAGIPVISKEIVKSLADSAIIIDVGKGVLFNDAIDFAHTKEIKIYRLDISSSLEGLIASALALEDFIDNKQGRKVLFGENIISGGLFGHFEEIIVDNINLPRIVYGFADGNGEIIHKLNDNQKDRLQKFQNRLDKINE